MGAPKLKRFPQKEMTMKEAEENIRDKAEIESFKKALQEKLRDPEMAKKAARILEDLIQKK
jgi:hypothetical protein